MQTNKIEMFIRNQMTAFYWMHLHGTNNKTRTFQKFDPIYI